MREIDPCVRYARYGPLLNIYIYIMDGAPDVMYIRRPTVLRELVECVGLFLSVCVGCLAGRFECLPYGCEQPRLDYVGLVQSSLADENEPIGGLPEHIGRHGDFWAWEPLWLPTGTGRPTR